MTAFISMFSGIEAASVAVERAGLDWQALALAEVAKFQSAVLAHHYPTVPNVGDMTAHDWSQYAGRCDIVVGGPPCQAFSVAGLRKSLDDDRGNLTLEFVRAIHAIRPVCAVVENVPGLLNTEDNAFGCFLAGVVGADDPVEGLPNAKPGEPERFGKWPDAGMVEGPRARAAWRVLDAQHFGLAQRRQRVFVVISFGDRLDPAKVLFEPQGVRRDTAKGRGEGQVAPTIPARSLGGGGLGTDFDCDGGLIAYGGNNTSGPIDIATAVNAHGGPHGRLDFESETFIAHTLRGEGFDASEDGTGRGTPIIPVAYRTSGNCGAWETGDRVDALTTGTDPNSHVIAFSSKDHGADACEDLSPTLRAGAFDKSHANAGVPPAIAFALRGREGGAMPEIEGDGDRIGTLRAASGGSSRDYVSYGAPVKTTGHQGDNVIGEGDIWPCLAAQNANNGGGGGGGGILHATHAVRRLTATECERLQGFPDGYTAIPWRGKPASECPDGPRYMSLGNSWAVNVVVWLFTRIDDELKASARAAA